jgi:hypothetical protein
MRLFFWPVFSQTKSFQPGWSTSDEGSSASNCPDQCSATSHSQGVGIMAFDSLRTKSAFDPSAGSGQAVHNTPLHERQRRRPLKIYTLAMRSLRLRRVVPDRGKSDLRWREPRRRKTACDSELENSMARFPTERMRSTHSQGRWSLAFDSL